MTDEPTLGEALRRLDDSRNDMREGFAQINQRLDRLVTESTFNREQQRVDEKLRDLAQDIAEERQQRATAIADERRQWAEAVAAAERAREDGDMRQQVLLDKLTGNLRWVAAAIALPIALFIANLVIASRGSA